MDNELAHVVVPLGGTPHGIELDEVRQRAIITMPVLNNIVVVSTLTYEVLGQYFVGQAPRGLTLSSDGEEIYVALNQSGSVAVVDADDYSVLRTINCLESLDNVLTWDVSEGKPGFLYVSANPGSGGFARIAQVDLENNDAQTTVATNRIIRAAPVFAESPDGQFLYIGEGFSPNSLYKLDLTQPQAPIVLEDDHGSVSGTSALAVTEDGGRIITASGQVLSTVTFGQLGLVSAGLPAVDRADAVESFWMTSSTFAGFREFDLNTFGAIDLVPSTCSLSTSGSVKLIAFAVRRGGLGYLTLSGTTLCAETVVGPPFVQLTNAVPNRARFDAPPTEVTLNGLHFESGAIVSVEVGGETVEAEVLSNTALKFTVPSGRPGALDIVVTNTSGPTVLERAFHRTPSLVAQPTSVAPGGVIAVACRIDPNDLCILFYGAAQADQLLAPFGGFLSIDATTSAAVITQLYWPFDSFGMNIPIPDDPSLVGIEVRLQMLAGQFSPVDAAFTNAADVVIE